MLPETHNVELNHEPDTALITLAANAVRPGKDFNIQIFEYEVHHVLEAYM